MFAQKPNLNVYAALCIITKKKPRKNLNVLQLVNECTDCGISPQTIDAYNNMA